MMKVLHASDLHGWKWNLLWAKPCQDYDLVLLTGDMFPNWSRGPDGGQEAERQKTWLLSKAMPGHPHHRLGMAMAEFGERPIVVVDGNHDFFELGGFMIEQGYTNVYPVRPGSVHELFGHRIAGFRQIPWIAGEWAGEVSDEALKNLSAQVLSPTIRASMIVNHAPIAGVLDKGYGIRPMNHALSYLQPDWVKYYFHGHVHETGGQQRVLELGGYNEGEEIFKVQVFNGATRVMIREIEEGPFK